MIMYDDLKRNGRGLFQGIIK